METVAEIRARAAASWHDATELEMTIPSTIGEEKAINPFMRPDSPEIIASVQKRAPGTPTDNVSILGAVRRMKDSF
jgi:hydroxyacylglutathione hydrolase